MKKSLIFAGLLSSMLATAQTEKRVGINTDTPRASLEVLAVNNGKAQGILFPHINEEEKAKWTTSLDEGLVAGTVIWNTTKLCLDYFDGTKWICTDGTKSNVHPTPWTPGASSFTGRAIWGDDASEKLSIAKDDCPTGQRGVVLTYPADASQQIVYEATSTISQADADQKALDLMNSAEKQAERQALAQVYANANGSCENIPATSFTGRAIWGDDAGEKLSVTKDNCPTGQHGVAMTYPANASQQIVYEATSTISQADANQKALDLMNSTANRNDRQQKAQAYANANGTCENTTPINTDITLPSGITISNGQHWIASIKDSDYLPFTAPTEAASWTRTHNPGGADTPIDVQGVVPSAGISVNIPVTVTGTVNLPAYKAYALTPADAWKDKTAKYIELSWEAKSMTSSDKSISAVIKVKDATTNQNLTQLDLREGLGKEYKGLLLGQFKMPKNNTENGSTKYTGTYEVRVISGIPDRKFGEADKKHDFLYVPVTAEDGKIWLNNNLGAVYSNLRDTVNFNPAQQATSASDPLAYGSLFQWQRPADGHEMIPRVTVVTSYFVRNYTTDEISYGWYAGHPYFIRTTTYNDSWVDEDNQRYGSMSQWFTNGGNNPCPENFHVPREEEWENLITKTNKVVGTDTPALSETLRLASAGMRDRLSGVTDTGIRYWTSTPGNQRGRAREISFNLTTNSLGFGDTDHGYGLSVRCIQD